MSSFNAIVLTRIAKVALTQGYGVVKDGKNIADLPAGSNEICIGIVEYDVEAEAHVAIVKNGNFEFAVAGAAIADGKEVIMDATGRFIELPAVAGTYNVVGICQKTVAAAGDLFELVIQQRSVEV